MKVFTAFDVLVFIGCEHYDLVFWQIYREIDSEKYGDRSYLSKYHLRST